MIYSLRSDKKNSKLSQHAFCSYWDSIWRLLDKSPEPLADGSAGSQWWGCHQGWSLPWAPPSAGWRPRRPGPRPPWGWSPKATRCSGPCKWRPARWIHSRPICQGGALRSGARYELRASRTGKQCSPRPRPRLRLCSISLNPPQSCRQSSRCILCCVCNVSQSRGGQALSCRWSYGNPQAGNPEEEMFEGIFRIQTWRISPCCLLSFSRAICSLAVPTLCRKIGSKFGCSVASVRIRCRKPAFRGIDKTSRIVLDLKSRWPMMWPKPTCVGKPSKAAGWLSRLSCPRAGTHPPTPPTLVNCWSNPLPRCLCCSSQPLQIGFCRGEEVAGLGQKSLQSIPWQGGWSAEGPGHYYQSTTTQAAPTTGSAKIQACLSRWPGTCFVLSLLNLADPRSFACANCKNLIQTIARYE